MTADELNKLRAQMAILARKRECRIVPRSAQFPCRWQPHQVFSAEHGLPFTESGAWELIADHLEAAATAVQELELETPAGVTALVMNISLQADRPALYVKVHLGGTGKIFGRSFHYSDR